MVHCFASEQKQQSNFLLVYFMAVQVFNHIPLYGNRGLLHNELLAICIKPDEMQLNFSSVLHTSYLSNPHCCQTSFSTTAACTCTQAPSPRLI